MSVESNLSFCTEPHTTHASRQGTAEGGSLGTGLRLACFARPMVATVKKKSLTRSRATSRKVRFCSASSFSFLVRPTYQGLQLCHFLREDVDVRVRAA